MNTRCLVGPRFIWHTLPNKAAFYHLLLQKQKPLFQIIELQGVDSLLVLGSFRETKSYLVKCSFPPFSPLQDRPTFVLMQRCEWKIHSTSRPPIFLDVKKKYIQEKIAGDFCCLTQPPASAVANQPFLRTAKALAEKIQHGRKELKVQV